MSSTPSALSFTVRRPTPVSSSRSFKTRHLSSGRFATKQRKPQDSLVIPSKPNPDWREAARRRRAGCGRIQPHTSRAVSFVPDSADGSVGGTRDTIDSPQLSGLQINKRVGTEEGNSVVVEVVSTAYIDESTTGVVDETEDEAALRAILAGNNESGPPVDIVPIPPLSEEDALKQDVRELPDVATADDYERIPVSAFGVAMLRGMGWTDGAVAPKSDKRSKNALMGLYLPQARPSLLGIGAKEREPDDDGSEKKRPKGRDMRYIPVTRGEARRSEKDSSRSGSRHARVLRHEGRKTIVCRTVASVEGDRVVMTKATLTRTEALRHRASTVVRAKSGRWATELRNFRAFLSVGRQIERYR